MRARFPRLLEHRDRQRFAARAFLKLGEAKRRRHSSRSTADDEHIDFEGFASQRKLPASSFRLPALLNMSDWPVSQRSNAIDPERWLVTWQCFQFAPRMLRCLRALAP